MISEHRCRQLRERWVWPEAGQLMSTYGFWPMPNTRRSQRLMMPLGHANSRPVPDSIAALASMRDSAEVPLALEGPATGRRVPELRRTAAMARAS